MVASSYLLFRIGGGFLVRLSSSRWFQWRGVD